MWNSISANRSIPALDLPTGNPESILLENLLFRTVYNHKKPRRASNIEQKPIHFLHQSFSSQDCEDPPLSPTPPALWASALVIPDVESSPQICNHIQEIVAEEEAWEHAELSQKAAHQAADNALLGIFSSTYTKAVGSLKKGF